MAGLFPSLSLPVRSAISRAIYPIVLISVVSSLAINLKHIRESTSDELRLLGNQRFVLETLVDQLRSGSNPPLAPKTIHDELHYVGLSFDRYTPELGSSSTNAANMSSSQSPSQRLIGTVSDNNTTNDKPLHSGITLKLKQPST